MYITKKKGSADFTVAIDSGSGNKVKVVKELKDPSNTHNFSFGNIVGAVNNRLAMTIYLFRTPRQTAKCEQYSTQTT